MKKLFIVLFSIIIVFIVSLYAFDKDYILRGVSKTYLAGHSTANINDHNVFATHTIKAAEQVQPWKIQSQGNKKLDQAMLDYLAEFNTAAFLVIHHGEIVSETYFDGYDNRSKTNSFSMAKTVTTLLIGAAIEDGYIKGLEQKITDFLPEFSTDPLGKQATIGQLSAMTSGYEWNESYYSPFSPTVQLYYDDDVEKFVLNGKFAHQPGTVHYYSSASTQLLGVVLNRALKQHNKGSISEYLSEKLWQPLGMNDDALWHTDDQGLELTYCCINTNARNFAKLGQLMLNKGQWHNQQLIPEVFITAMTRSQELAANYGYSTWINNEHSPKFFWFSGHLGQYIINIPDEDLIIVRLGERRDVSKDFRTNELYDYVNAALKLIKR